MKSNFHGNTFRFRAQCNDNPIEWRAGIHNIADFPSGLMHVTIRKHLPPEYPSYEERLSRFNEYRDELQYEIKAGAVVDSQAVMDKLIEKKVNDILIPLSYSLFNLKFTYFFPDRAGVE